MTVAGRDRAAARADGRRRPGRRLAAGRRRDAAHPGRAAAAVAAALLDKAAVALLSGARLPPLPPDMPEAQVTVTVSLRYALER